VVVASEACPRFSCAISIFMPSTIAWLACECRLLTEGNRRHTHAGHALAAKVPMPLDVLQQNLGHASLGTTTVYVTTEKKRRMRAVDAFWKG
jgi:integrase